MNPSITPKISSVVALPNLFETARSISAVANAPAKAAIVTDRPRNIPEMLPADITARAAPNDAPELTPMICGSASGFLSMLCICVPARANEAPDNMAVSTRGTLSRQIIRGLPAPELPPQIRSMAVRTANKTAPAITTFMSLLHFIGTKLDKFLPKQAFLCRLIAIFG